MILIISLLLIFGVSSFEGSDAKYEDIFHLTSDELYIIDKLLTVSGLPRQLSVAFRRKLLGTLIYCYALKLLRETCLYIFYEPIVMILFKKQRRLHLQRSKLLSKRKLLKFLREFLMIGKLGCHKKMALP
ncbi:MAG: hypothetical protein NZM38_07600 [Cytophagales bacterium]|nr:hypothetical protein [Cytophagales bacterium]MDW8384620.1 hypothetical protein [Flammeovirgaceae bacterium]